MDTCLEHVELGVLIESHCQRIEVATVHSAISDVAFEGDAIEFAALEPLLVVGGDEATHVHDAVFLGRHRHGIHVAIHLAGNLLDGLVGISLLAGLDEIGVLGKAR